MTISIYCNCFPHFPHRLVWLPAEAEVNNKPINMQNIEQSSSAQSHQPNLRWACGCRQDGESWLPEPCTSLPVSPESHSCCLLVQMSCSLSQHWMINAVTEAGPGCVVAKYQWGSSFCLFGALELDPQGISGINVLYQSWSRMVKAGDVRILGIWTGHAEWPLQCSAHRTLLWHVQHLVWLYMGEFDPISVCDSVPRSLLLQ